MAEKRVGHSPTLQMMQQIKQENTLEREERSRGVIGWVENGLLVLCCIIVAGRGQIDEGAMSDWRLTGPPVTMDIGRGATPAMMIFSGLICTAALVWFMVHLAHGRLPWRKTGLGIGFLLLLAGRSCPRGSHPTRMRR
jgi:hypothetical protein